MNVAHGPKFDDKPVTDEANDALIRCVTNL